jgi:hypothetical protein
LAITGESLAGRLTGVIHRIADTAKDADSQ